MKVGRRRRIAFGSAVFAVALAAGAYAIASSSPPSDEQALVPTRSTTLDSTMEWRINQLISKMTLAEKLEQLTNMSDSQVTDADAKAGVGGVFSLTDPARIDHLQHIAVEQSRLQNMEYTHWILWSLPARMIPVGRTKYFVFSLRLYFTAKHAKKLRLPE